MQREQERTRTYFATGSVPSSGGEFGKYMNSGHSGGLIFGSHPKNVGLILTPLSTKSWGVGGIGGSA
jgi:hypothetical protein